VAVSGTVVVARRNNGSRDKKSSSELLSGIRQAAVCVVQVWHSDKAKARQTTAKLPLVGLKRKHCNRE
jgi:hypothetical protein